MNPIQSIKDFMAQLTREGIQHGELDDAFRLFERTGYTDTLKIAMAHIQTKFQIDRNLQAIPKTHRRAFLELRNQSRRLLDAVNQLPNWSPENPGRLRPETVTLQVICVCNPEMDLSSEELETLVAEKFKDIERDLAYTRVDIQSLPWDGEEHEPARVMVKLHVNSFIRMEEEDLGGLHGWECISRHNLQTMERVSDIIRKLQHALMPSVASVYPVGPVKSSSGFSTRNEMLTAYLELLRLTEPNTQDADAVTISRDNYDAYRTLLASIIRASIRKNYDLEI